VAREGKSKTLESFPNMVLLVKSLHYAVNNHRNILVQGSIEIKLFCFVSIAYGSMSGRPHERECSRCAAPGPINLKVQNWNGQLCTNFLLL